MKSDFKTKLIQHMLNKKNGEKGFTLIELLVVIIIIGILAAIALPSFLNQANKARQSEAKSYVGSMNRAQQAYFLEKSNFSSDIPKLGLGISTSTENYTYTVSKAAVSTAAASSGSAVAAGDPYANAFAHVNGTKSLKTYAGTTWLGQTAGAGESTTLAILCESTATATAASAPQPASNAQLSTVLCGTNMEAIK